MTGRSQYELHMAEMPLERDIDVNDLPWKKEPAAAEEPPFVVEDNAGLVRAGRDEQTGRLHRLDGSQANGSAVFALQVIHRRLSSDLALVAKDGEVLVNGLPALGFTVLGPKDSLCHRGTLYYVTRRICPYVGPPTEDMIGQKCPYCRVRIESDTHVVTCARCGAVYHNEAEESHPQQPQADRFDCLQHVRTCLICGHEMSLDEYLVWDPADV